MRYEPKLNAVPDAYYFDANPLIYWALGRAGSSEAYEQTSAANFERLVANGDSLACSAPTLAEFMSTVWSVVRSEKPKVNFFGEAEANSAMESLMGLMGNGRLRVQNLHPRAFEVGIAVVAAGTREQKGAFRAWDAIHLFEACQWARTIDQEVIVATADSDFSNIIAAFPEFGTYVSVLDLTQ